MANTENSINRNGCSVCGKGREKYTTFCAVKGKIHYQYDYRHTDGELFSTVAPSLDECREQRDKWVQSKNFKRLFSDTLKRVQENKRLTKSEMACQIGHIDTFHIVSLCWELFPRDEVVSTFNKMFGTEIK
jgi:hypothetical protein